MINPWLRFIEDTKGMNEKDINSEIQNNLNLLRERSHPISTLTKPNRVPHLYRTKYVKFILSNYIEFKNIVTKRPICNASFINQDNELFVIGRETNYNFLFKNLKLESDVTSTNTYSDEILYKFNESNSTAKLIKYITKSDKSLKWRFIGDEDIRVIKNNNEYLDVTFTRTNNDHQFYMHHAKLNKEFDLYDINMIDTGNKVEKNWQPIEGTQYYIYSYKPFKLIDIDNKEYKLIDNEFNINYSGSSPIIKFNDYYIGIIHNRIKINNSPSYIHYFIKYDKDLKLISLSPPFKFMGAYIEFNTSILNYNGKLRIIFSIYDNLSYWFDLDEFNLNQIFNSKFNNNSFNKESLYKRLHIDSLNNNLTKTANCMLTFI